jgi:D-aminoacyl-tRNA deacylase
MLSIVFSVKDPVGVNASKILVKNLDAKPSSCPISVLCYRSDEVVIAGFEPDQTLFEFLDVTPEPRADAVIVLSRHESQRGVRSLTVHFTGNPTSEAPFGGRPGELAFAPAPLAKALLQSYRRRAAELGLLERYSISLEATHHGPTGNMKPLVFIEIGSTENEWGDREALEAMAGAVLDVLTSGAVPRCSPTIGLGSTHYPEKFTELELGEGCMGHMFSKHVLGKLAPGALRQAVEKSLPNGASEALIEKKGASSSLRHALIDELTRMGVNVRPV